MSIADRVRESTKGDITPEDVDELLDRIESGNPNVYDPTRTLGTVADRYPDVVRQRAHRISGILAGDLPELVKRSLYRILLSTEELPPTVFSDALDAIGEDLPSVTAPTRGVLYELIERIATEDVRIPEELFETLVRSIAARPEETPFGSAMDAYVAIALQRDAVDDKQFAPLIDFIESDYPVLRIEATRALVEIVRHGTIDDTANSAGVRLTLESRRDASEDSVEHIQEALDRL